MELAICYGLIQLVIWTSRPTPTQRLLFWIAFAWIVATTLLYRPDASTLGLRVSGLRSLLWITAGGLLFAGLLVGILGGTSLLGRVGVGWLLDRFFGARVAFAITLSTASRIFLLARANSFAAGCLAAALIGIGAGGEAAITPYLLTRYFGLRSFSTLYGVTWTFYAAAAAVGPVILGRAFDSTGSYTSLLVILAAALALAAAMNLFLPRYSDSAVTELT